MGNNSKVTDIRSVIEESVHNFFLEAKHGATLIFRVHRIEASQIHIGVPGGVSLSRDVKGYLVAAGFGGIYRIEGEFEELPTGDSGYDIAPIAIDMDRVQFENRRRNFRCQFENPPPATLTGVNDGAKHEVAVLDLSASGIRVRSSSALELEQLFRVEFATKLGSEVTKFSFNAEVIANIGQIYSDHQTLQDAYGMWIVSAKNPSVDELRELTDLQRRIARFCNHYIMFQRRMSGR